MAWRVFRSLEDGRSALRILSVYGFYTAEQERRTLRLVLSERTGQLHAQHTCIKITSDRTLNLDTLLKHAESSVRYLSVRDLLYEGFDVCEICVPGYVSGALSDMMNFCHAVIDLENSPSPTTTSPAIFLDMFSKYMTLADESEFCSKERSQMSLQKCVKIIKDSSSVILDNAARMSALELLAAEVLSKSDADLQAEFDRFCASTKLGYRNYSGEFSVDWWSRVEAIGERSEGLAALFYVSPGPPRTASPVSVALCADDLSVARDGGGFVCGSPLIAEPVVAEDSRFSLLGFCPKDASRELCSLASRLLETGGCLANPSAAVASAAIVSGVCFSELPRVPGVR